ncbi:MAG: hypothetical protein ACRDBX_06070 [Erysipelotrichaceae bacterium]
MTRTVVFVKGLNSAEMAQRIEEVLADTRVGFTIDMENHAVVVNGDHDMASIVKLSLAEHGFVIL